VTSPVEHKDSRDFSPQPSVSLDSDGMLAHHPYSGKGLWPGPEVLGLRVEAIHDEGLLPLHFLLEI